MSGGDGDGVDVDTRRGEKEAKYPYLTWHLRTKLANVEVEQWIKEKWRKEKKTAEECEEEMKVMERDNKDKVMMWLMREGEIGVVEATNVFLK